MAVSKTRNISEIRQAIEAGFHIFGENRVEEASRKFPISDSIDHQLYLIGHLQSNKATKIDERYSGVHSLDSLSLAKKLSRFRQKIQKPLEVLIQVNTSGEGSKSGFRDKEELIESAAEISELPFLELRGLMTMAPFVDDEHIIRKCFSLCREWASSVEPFISGKLQLSMGMSSDYYWAIQEGSTILRIGTTIFGRRE